MKFDKKLVSLPVGVAVFAFLALAGLVGVLALNPAQPTEAQTSGCDDVGSGDTRKGVCSFSYAENDTGQVGRLTTRELDQRQVVKVWELVLDDTDFPDHADFRIDRKSGALTFKRTPDYEDPMSSVTAGTLAERNVYKVKAKLGDGEKFVYTEVTVRVAGVEEAETLTLSARQPEVGVPLTATLAGGDIRGLRTPDWKWQVENDSGGWDDITDAVNRSHTPEDEDVGKKLRAYVSYQDSHGTDITKLGDPLLLGTGVTEFPVRAEPGRNGAPMFRENDEVPGTGVDQVGIQTSRRIEENTPPGMRVGPPVFATDDNHLPWNHADDPGGPRDVLTYSLSDGLPTTTTGSDDAATEDDGLFSIDQITGQILTRAPLNKESGLEDRDDAVDGVQLEVTAIATDPSGDTGMVMVTIHVLDVDEAPEITGPAAITYFENRTGATPLILHTDPNSVETTDQVVYNATDNDLDDETGTPASTEIQWELRGDDASKFQFVGSEVTYTDSGPITPAVVATGPPPTVTTAAMAPSPALQFKSAPDLENPADEGGTPGDNVYEITVVAWDGDWEIGSREVTIRVANSDDLGTITLSHIQPEVGTKITATLNDPDGVSQTVTWVWESPSGTEATGTVTSSGVTSTYTPVAADTNPLTVTATYTDSGSTIYGTGDGQTTPPTATSALSTRAAPAESNQAPKFYSDTTDLTDDDARVAENEVTSYTRYVLENQTRNVTRSGEDARGYDDGTPTITGVVAVYDTWDNSDNNTDDPGADGTTGRETLQFDLSGPDAKHFAIRNDTTPVEQRGLISTKGPLDFEEKSTYSVTVTATDPSGATDTVTVTIHVLDVPEIMGLEERIRVPENTKIIKNISVADPPDVSLGGLKWSLLTTTADPGLEAQTTPPHNRNDERSIDCQADATNEFLCDDFRFSNFNSANTTLLFAIGTGEDHDAPNYEKPADVGGADEEEDNVYKIVVRVAFANLRSQQGDPIPANHPNPEDDERQDFPVWIRVDDVDEAPKFADDASNRLILENSDDALPGVAINRSVVGTVTASDPEYGYADGSQSGKKLVYSLDAGAYDNLFQIVPSTGEILTRSRLNYEALTELTEMGPGGGQHRIITGSTVTATDSAMPMGNSADIPTNIRVNDVNETPLPEDDLIVTGMSAVSDYAEGQADTTVAAYRATGESAAMATWTLSGADMDDFMLEPDTGGASVMLKFMSVPDFENPTDADMDNTYMVTLTAMAGGITAPSRDVTVTVTNADDMGSVTVTPTPAVVGTQLTASLSDPDGGVMNVMWDWWVDDSVVGDFSVQIDGELSATFTPTTAQEGKYIKARAVYDDAEGMGKIAPSMAIEVMSADPNQALIDDYDVDGDGLDRTDVIAAIHRYLGGDPDVTRSDVIALIQLYLGS